MGERNDEHIKRLKAKTGNAWLPRLAVATIVAIVWYLMLFLRT